MIVELKNPKTLDSVRKRFFNQILTRDKIRKVQNLELIRKPKPVRQVQNRRGRDYRANNVVEGEEKNYEVSSAVVAPATSTPVLQALGMMLPVTPTTGVDQQKQESIKPQQSSGNWSYQTRGSMYGGRGGYRGVPTGRGGYQGYSGGTGGYQNQPYRMQPVPSNQGSQGGTMQPGYLQPENRITPTCEHCGNSLPWAHWQSNCLQKIFQIRSGIESTKTAYNRLMQILMSFGYKGNERPSDEMWIRVLNEAPKERREAIPLGTGPKN